MDDSLHSEADEFIDEDTDDDDLRNVFTIYPMPGGLNAGAARALSLTLARTVTLTI